MKNLWIRKQLTLVLCIPFIVAGCTSSPKELTRSHARLEKTAKSEFIDLDSHKDVKVDEVERVSPDGSRVVIKGYQSSANAGALEASTQQFNQMSSMFMLMQQNFNAMADRLAEKAAAYFSGGAVRPAPVIQVVTNYVTVPSTNAVTR